MKKWLYIVLGSVTLALGTLGIFLPVLPTTPFYLLTAWFFMRGSDRLYARVMANKYFGSIVYNYQKNKAISKRSRIVALITLWGSILFSIYLVEKLWLRCLLFVIAVGVTIHLVSLKTMKKTEE